MTVTSGMNTALAGVNKGLREMMAYAGKIASTGASVASEPTELAEAVVGMKRSQLQVAASVKVVETFDQVLGTLLDEKV